MKTLLPRSTFVFAGFLFLLFLAPSSALSNVTAAAVYIDHYTSFGRGCGVRTVGVITTDPPGFSGEVIFIGEPGCWQASASFRMVPDQVKKGDLNVNNDPKNLTLRFDTKNFKKVKLATWSGSNTKAVEILSEKSVNDKFCKNIRESVSDAESGKQTVKTKLLTPWNLGTLESGKKYPTQINIQNISCEGKQTLTAIAENLPWLKIEGAERVENVAMGETRPVKAIIDLTGVAPGEYKGSIAIVCLTCPPPPKCVQDISQLNVNLIVK